jgi:hypothetical protein
VGDERLDSGQLALVGNVDVHHCHRWVLEHVGETADIERGDRVGGCRRRGDRRGT